MVTYDVVIHGSQELRDYCESEHGDRLRAQERAVTYLEGAGDRLYDHTINAQAIDTDVPAPIEDYHTDSAFEYTMCYGSEVEYNWLHAWLRDYAGCYGIEDGDDCTILLTSIDGRISGGAMDPGTGHSTVTTGQLISHLPSSYQERGDSYAIDAAETLLHEFGHYAMGHVEDSHQRGDEWYATLDNSNMTVMGNGLSDGDTNYCGQDVDIRGGQGFELYWDDCCRQEW